MQHAEQGEQVEAGYLPTERAGMSDIVERLRSLRHIHVPQLSDEAAAEIERVRQVAAQKNLTLTDAEREAVEWFAGLRPNRPLGARTRLKTFLERTK